MDKKHKRNLILHINNLQQRMLLPILIASFFACFIALISLQYLYLYSEETSAFFALQPEDLKMVLPWILAATGFVLVFLIFWTYYFSNKLVGPYERILKELDDVVAGKSKGPLGTRKGDEIFESLLKRINVLLAKLP